MIRSDRINLFGYGLVLAVLTAGGALGLRNVAMLAKTEAAVAHTHEVIGAIENLMSTLKDAETGQRGFLLVREASYLEPYRAAMSTISTSESSLRALVADNPVQQDRVRALGPKIVHRIVILDRGIELATTVGDSAARAWIATDSGKRVMDEIRADLLAMTVTERGLLTQRNDEARASRTFSYASMVGSGLIGAGLIGVIATVTSRRLRDQRTADDQMAEQGERTRTTLASIGDAVITTDVNGRVESMNAVAEALTGWSLDRASGAPLMEVFRIVNEGTRKSVESPATRALLEGVIVGLANHTILISRDGTEHFIDDSAAPIRSRDGTISGCVLVFRDIGEQKQDERSIAESEARFRMLSDNIAPLTWFAEADGSIPWYSKRWYDYTGSTPEEMVGWGWQKVHDPSHVDAVRERFKAAVASGTEWEDTFPIRGADGNYRWFISRAVPVRDETGAIVRWIGSNTDVTELRETTEALRLSDLRYRKALEAVNSLIWTNDASGRMLGEQPWWAAFTGQSYDEYQGYGWATAVHPDDAQPTIDAWNLAVASRSTFVFEHRVRRRDGDWRTCTIRAIPVIGAGGEIYEWVGVHTDVTDARAAAARERALIADVSIADAKFRALFDQGAYMAAIIDPDGTIIEPNRLSWEAAGASREELVGKKFWELGVFAESLGLQAQVRSATEEAASGSTVRRELPYFPGNGPSRIVDMTIVPVRDEAGNVAFLAPTGTDVTERVEAQKQLRRSEEELRRIASALSDADHRKDEFLATLAHELRNPLAPIRNGLQIMRIAANDPAAMERSQAMIERQVEHLVRLVDDLMDISRISRGTIQLREEPLDLASVLRHAVETSSPLIDQKQQILVVEPPSQPLPVFGDRTRLTQVFSNLLNNASRYTNHGGTISMRAVVVDTVAEVRIRDTGVGISKDMLSEIFEMFAQVDRSLERSQSGLGIGLTLVRRLTDMHGGSVQALSEGLGHGSEFVVRIPLTDHQQEAPRRDVNGGASSTTQRRILVVDDNVDSAQSLSNLLAMMGHEVRVAHDGLQALIAAESFQPQVVMMDIGMPRLNGYEACRALRARPWAAKTRIIALTGWGQATDRERSLDAGFDQHLVKPVDPNALHELMLSDGEA